MAGDSRQYDLRGIVPRAIQQIFREVDARVDKQISVRMSYLEIYNEVRGPHAVGARGNGLD
jgi:kinesin family member 6/9